MADIVNLNKARKAKLRAERAETAQQNRAIFGESKANKSKRLAEANRVQRAFEAHRQSEEPERND